MRTYWEPTWAEQTCVGPIFARQTSAPQTWLTADEMRGGLGLKGPANVTRAPRTKRVRARLSLGQTLRFRAPACVRWGTPASMRSCAIWGIGSRVAGRH